MELLKKLALSVVIAVVVTLACVLLGMILATLVVPVAVTVGGFLIKYSGVFGVAAGIWYFFTH